LSLGPVIAWIAQKRAGTEGGSAGCAILVCVPKKGREIKNQHSWGTCRNEGLGWTRSWTYCSSYRSPRIAAQGRACE
jgi:hypothetical protein